MSQPILVATDLSSRCDRAVDRAILLGRQVAAPVIALHVASGEEAPDPHHIARLRAELAAQLGEGEAELLVECDADVPAAVARIAADRSCGLILTGVARFNQARDYFLGTAVDALIRASDVPVLVVKQRPCAPYCRIVAATDFSDNAVHALETAAAIFPQVELRAVHASQSAYETWLDESATADFLKNEAEKDMAAFLARLPDAVRMRVEPCVEVGAVESALMLEIDTGRADLLVLGTHGRSAFAHVAIGSRASDMLQSLPIDALVVKGGTRT